MTAKKKSTGKKVRRRWRSAFGPDEVIQRVRPTESDDYLLNPHKGTTTFQRFNGDALYPGLGWSDRDGPETFKPFKGDPKRLHNARYPDTTISYCRWVWSVIEPEKGKFRWDIIDGALKAAAERGQTLQARVQPSAGHAPYPDWFWKDKGARKVKDPTGFRGADLHPDFNCPAYLKHWPELIRAFAKRYDGHPNLESFDVAYAGGCGETGGNSTTRTAERLVDAYLDGFHKTQLIGMLGTHGCKYAGRKRPDLGWRADCFGDVHIIGKNPDVPAGLNWNHMYDSYPRSLFESEMQDRWRQAPVTFETCWVVGHWYREGWDVDWIIDQGLKYHVSVFMPKSCYIPKRWDKKIDEFNRRMGYRFVLRQMTLPLEARPGQRVEFNMWIENVGVAPIYHPYKLALRFRQGRREEIVHSKQDITRWMPDHNWFRETFVFPRTLAKGEVDLHIALVDPNTNAPRVKFAIKEIDKDDWHPMGRMDVV